MLCWSHIPDCWKSHALAQILANKANLTFAVDNNFKFCGFFKNNKYDMILHEDRLCMQMILVYNVPDLFENQAICCKICRLLHS